MKLITDLPILNIILLKGNEYIEIPPEKKPKSVYFLDMMSHVETVFHDVSPDEFG
jgi:hypothetical protein